MTHRQAVLLTIAGGVLVAIGSFMPWVTVTTGFGQVDVVGTTGDGTITLGLGAIIAILAFLNLNRASSGARLLLLVLGVASAGLGAFEFTNVTSGIGSTSSDFLRASVGYGIYLLVIGGGAAIIGTLKMEQQPVTPSA
jgi:hypothetical protein